MGGGSWALMIRKELRVGPVSINKTGFGGAFNDKKGVRWAGPGPFE